MKVRAGIVRCGALAMAVAGVLAAGVAAAGTDDRWYVAGSVAGAARDSYGNDGVAGRLGAGWRFSEHFSAELGYARPVDAGGGRQVVDGGELALRGELPVRGKLSAFGRVGVFKWDEQGAFADEGTDFTGGVGMRYAVSDALSLTGSVDYYEGVGVADQRGTEQLNFGVQVDF
jgi:hypothetical protein